MTQLAHTLLGAAPQDADVVLLLAHGILGSRNNWRSFARRLTRERPDVCVVTLDLRGHGESHGLPGAPTVRACADDVVALATALLGPDLSPPLVVGHSFGGKVMAEVARTWPVRQLWVLDAPLGARDGSASDAPTEVESVVAALRDISMPLAERADVADALRRRGFSSALGQWMTTNLRRADGGYVWRFDLDLVEALLADYFARDLWDAFSLPRQGAQHVLVRGARSERWTAADTARLDALHRAGRARHLELADAGHWLHADNPAGLLRLLVDGLPR